MNLIEYTGGSIVLEIAFLSLVAIALIISLIALFIRIVNNKNINKVSKLEYTFLVILAMFFIMTISGMIGYYLGLLN